MISSIALMLTKIGHNSVFIQNFLINQETTPTNYLFLCNLSVKLGKWNLHSWKQYEQTIKSFPLSLTIYNPYFQQYVNTTYACKKVILVFQFSSIHVLNMKFCLNPMSAIKKRSTKQKWKTLLQKLLNY